MDYCSCIVDLMAHASCWTLLQVSKLLQYAPQKRLTAVQAMTHPFFDELREPGTKLPNGARGCGSLVCPWSAVQGGLGAAADLHERLNNRFQGGWGQGSNKGAHPICLHMHAHHMCSCMNMDMRLQGGLCLLCSTGCPGSLTRCPRRLCGSCSPRLPEAQPAERLWLWLSLGLHLFLVVVSHLGAAACGAASRTSCCHRSAWGSPDSDEVCACVCVRYAVLKVPACVLCCVLPSVLDE